MIYAERAFICGTIAQFCVKRTKLTLFVLLYRVMFSTVSMTPQTYVWWHCSNKILDKFKYFFLLWFPLSFSCHIVSSLTHVRRKRDKISCCAAGVSASPLQFNYSGITTCPDIHSSTAFLTCWPRNTPTWQIFRWTPVECVCVWRSNGAAGWWLQICDPQPIEQTLPPSFPSLLIFVHLMLNFFRVSQVLSVLFHPKQLVSEENTDLMGEVHKLTFSAVVDHKASETLWKVVIFKLEKTVNEDLSVSWRLNHKKGH